MTAVSGLFFVDYVFRPFAKIFEKKPLVMLVLLLCLYGFIGYVVLRSAFNEHSEHPTH
jgi:hypothetical protein